MARPLRIELAGGLYHVMSRGNERRAIVRDDADRQRRLDWLQRTVEVYGWRLHAFVLMTNHDHFFLETPEPNLSAGMHLLNGSYTGYFNLRHRRVGHLFQGRFKAHLIEEQGYFTEISRYIHLNPVRAKLVERPEQWRWSSYGGYRRTRAALGWVTYDRVLGEFGGMGAEARARYCRFVQAGVAEPPRAVEGRLGRLRGGLRVVRNARATPAGRPPSRWGGSPGGTLAGASFAGSDRERGGRAFWLRGGRVDVGQSQRCPGSCGGGVSGAATIRIPHGGDCEGPWIPGAQRCTNCRRSR